MPHTTLEKHPTNTNSGNLFAKTEVTIVEFCEGKQAVITQEQFQEYIKSSNPILAIECPKCRKTVYVVGVSI